MESEKKQMERENVEREREQVEKVARRPKEPRT